MRISEKVPDAALRHGFMLKKWWSAGAVFLFVQRFFLRTCTLQVLRDFSQIGFHLLADAAHGLLKGQQIGFHHIG